MAFWFTCVCMGFPASHSSVVVHPARFDPICIHSPISAVWLVCSGGQHIASPFVFASLEILVAGFPDPCAPVPVSKVQLYAVPAGSRYTTLQNPHFHPVYWHSTPFTCIYSIWSGAPVSCFTPHLILSPWRGCCCTNIATLVCICMKLSGCRQCLLQEHQVGATPPFSLPHKMAWNLPHASSGVCCKVRRAPAKSCL